nr:hypothetical protein CFP56_20677 [Quercus suber]
MVPTTALLDRVHAMPGSKYSGVSKNRRVPALQPFPDRDTYSLSQDTTQVQRTGVYSTANSLRLSQITFIKQTLSRSPLSPRDLFPSFRLQQQEILRAVSNSCFGLDWKRSRWSSLMEPLGEQLSIYWQYRLIKLCTESTRSPWWQ